MNSTFERLARQSGAHWNHGDFNMASSVEFQESDLEKFAELIVKECARIIENRAPGQLGMEYVGWTNGFDDGLHAAAFLIKQHFGVDE